MRCFAVICGGGSAGHVLPALAVAEALEDAGHAAAELHYIGACRGIEARLLPPTGYAHTLLDVDGVQRGLSRRDLRRNVRFLPKLARAATAATKLLRELRPRVVVTVGGYASLPAVLAARRLAVPIVVVTYDRRPGKASALTARFAAAVAAAYPGSRLARAPGRIGPAAIVEVTGAPVRRAIRDVDRAAGRDAARAALGLDAARFVVAVIGGSLGSAALNAAISRFVTERSGDRQLAVHHVTGERFVGHVGPGSDGSDGIAHRVVSYEERMDLVYAAADVLVGRGGATTIAEVAVTGTPAVLVPWPGAAEDHQTDNVRWLADSGGAVLLPEAEIGRLGEVLDDLRSDPERTVTLGRRAHELGAVHRSGRMADLVERVALA